MSDSHAEVIKRYQKYGLPSPSFCFLLVIARPPALSPSLTSFCGKTGLGLMARSLWFVNFLSHLMLPAQVHSWCPEDDKACVDLLEAEAKWRFRPRLMACFTNVSVGLQRGGTLSFVCKQSEPWVEPVSPQLGWRERLQLQRIILAHNNRPASDLTSEVARNICYGIGAFRLCFFEV